MEALEPAAASNFAMPIPLASVAARQRWLEPIAERLQAAVRRGLESLGPRRDLIEGFLHGEPLGHPLHVMLTDVPLGAWTTAAAFDVLHLLTRKDEWESAARGAIGVGLLGALGAVVTGLADWSQLSGEERRVGLAHGLLNIAGVGLMATSFARRGRGQGRLAGLAGYALAIASARLGGHLVYRAGVGVRAAGRQPIIAPRPTREAA